MSISKLFGLQENYAAHGGQVDHLMDVIHWFMLALFIGWSLFFLFCIWRFWHKRSPKASYEGVRSHLSSHLEIGVIIVEAVLLLGFAFPLWAERVDTWDDVQKLDPVRVRVVGWQFGWTYHYSGADGKFGRVEPALISGSNDLGIDYTDPNALDDFTTSVLRLPVNRPAVLNIGSKDVIHGYAIHPLRIQQDAIPGKEIAMWFTPVRTLETYVVCSQLCGEKHADMLGLMEVIPAGEFQSWFDTQTQSALEANTAAHGAQEAATPTAAPAPEEIAAPGAQPAE
jgi:cytochrome c oxidase subunit 2